MNKIFLFFTFIIGKISASTVDYNITELLDQINMSNDFGDTIIEVSVPHQFRYVPVTKKGCFNFWVKTDNEAQISLSNNAQYSYPQLKIIIGGWDNTISAVGVNEYNENLVFKTSTPGIINKNQFDGYWIRWSTHGDIFVGKFNERMPFLVYRHKGTWFPINFIGLANIEGRYGSGTGTFIVKDEHRCPF